MFSPAASTGQTDIVLKTLDRSQRDRNRVVTGLFFFLKLISDGSRQDMTRLAGNQIECVEECVVVSGLTFFVSRLNPNERR